MKSNNVIVSGKVSLEAGNPTRYPTRYPLTLLPLFGERSLIRRYERTSYASVALFCLQVGVSWS